MLGIIGSLSLTVILSYLWGSIPSGYWMGKLLRGKNFDIRAYGSHKTGATNVLRVFGKIPAAIVFMLDISKGIGPALLASYVPLFYAGGWGIMAAGLAALLGHNYPIFIGFKGGRGVSTGAGTLLIVSPLSFLITGIVTLCSVLLWRFVSLGSILGCLAAIICGISFYVLGQTNPTFFAKLSFPQMLFLIIVPTIIILSHSDNISRLLAGKERKIGQKETIPTSAEPNTPSNLPV